MNRVRKYFNNKINICLAVLVLITAVSVIYSMFTFGLTYIHSDNAAELTAIDSILRHKDLFPEEWIYNNGDINFMRIQVFLLLPFLLIGNVPVAREVGALLVIILASLAIRNVSKKLFKDNSWLLAVPVCWLMLNEKITRDVTMYSNMYGSTVLWSCLLAVLLYKVFATSDKKAYFLFALVEVLVLIGGIRWVAEIALPLMMVAFWATFYDFKGDGQGKKGLSVICLIKNECLVLIPALFGFCIFKYVSFKCDFYVNTSSSVVLPNSALALIKNIRVVLSNFYRCFGYDGEISIFSISGIIGLLSIFICTIVCFVVPVLQLLRIKKESLSVKFFLVLAYMHNAILVSAAIISTKLTSYYVVSSIFLCIVISSRYLYRYIEETTIAIKSVVIVIFTGLVLFNSFNIISNSRGWREKYSRERALGEKLEATGAEKGYATFWNAYTNQMYADNAYRMGAISLDDYFISAYYCLVDKSVYNVEDCKSFLILNDAENKYYGTVEFFFEKPVDSWVEEGYPTYNGETKELERQNLHIYVYDYDIASRLNNGMQDGIINPIEIVVNDKCEKTFDYIVLNNGAVTHGPYNTIYKGDYLVQFRGANVDDLSIDFATEYKDALSYEIEDRSDNIVVINLHVEKSIDDFDIVLKNDGNVQIVLQDIIFE